MDPDFGVGGAGMPLPARLIIRGADNENFPVINNLVAGYWLNADIVEPADKIPLLRPDRHPVRRGITEYRFTKFRRTVRRQSFIAAAVIDTARSVIERPAQHFFAITENRIHLYSTMRYQATPVTLTIPR